VIAVWSDRGAAEFAGNGSDGVLVVWLFVNVDVESRLLCDWIFEQDGEASGVRFPELIDEELLLVDGNNDVEVEAIRWLPFLLKVLSVLSELLLLDLGRVWFILLLLLSSSMLILLLLLLVLSTNLLRLEITGLVLLIESIEIDMMLSTSWTISNLFSSPSDLPSKPSELWWWYCCLMILVMLLMLNGSACSSSITRPFESDGESGGSSNNEPADDDDSLYWYSTASYPGSLPSPINLLSCCPGWTQGCVEAECSKVHRITRKQPQQVVILLDEILLYVHTKKANTKISLLVLCFFSLVHPFPNQGIIILVRACASAGPC
jgi:hypothetical protein